MSAGLNGVVSPRIAVLIPCFNDGEFVRRAVGSLREAEPLELVVIDDGSTDPITTEVIDDLAARGVRVVRQATNSGVSAARMAGLAASSAPFVVSLDADDLAIPGVLAEMADRLERDPSVSACLGDYVEFGEHLLVRAVPEKLDPYRVAYANEYPPSALFRRGALLDVGGWRAASQTIDSRSDWGLWMSLAEAGHQITHLGPGRLLYCYRIHGGRLQVRGRRFHRQIYGALRRQHPQLFGELKLHRRATTLSRGRQALYPLLYGRRLLRPPRFDMIVKRRLDGLGLWTLQRELQPAVSERLAERLDDLESQAIEAGHTANQLPRLDPGCGGAWSGRGLGLRPPIIVIGAGRSGTALTTRILEQLGVFMGAVQDENAESVHFIRLNTWALSKAGASWDQPARLQTALADSAFEAGALRHFESRLSLRRARAYFGWINPIAKNMRSIRGAWGWKDPRTTFTLGLWLELFPDAKVVHVLRHGADVSASSYRVQESRPSRPRFIWQALRRRRFHVPTIVREVVTYARRPDSSARFERLSGLEDAIRLWDESVSHCERASAELGEKIWTGRFEDLAKDPLAWVSELAAFCGIDASPQELQRAAALVRPSRRFAYLNDPELRALAESHATRLAARGYSPTGFAPTDPAPEPNTNGGVGGTGTGHGDGHDNGNANGYGRGYDNGHGDGQNQARANRDPNPGAATAGPDGRPASEQILHQAR